jgi:hypothetical protein
MLFVSLYRELGDERRVAKAERLVAEVEWVLRRPRVIRIGEAPDRDGQNRAPPSAVVHAPLTGGPTIQVALNGVAVSRMEQPSRNHGGHNGLQNHHHHGSAVQFRRLRVVPT